MEKIPQQTNILTLLESAIEAHASGDSKFTIDIAALDLKVHIKGKNWSGLVDKPVAKFIVEFDEKIRRELKNAGVTLPKTDHGVIALEVREGSMDGWIQLTKEFVALYKSVDLGSQIALLAAIVTGLGIYRLPTIIAAINAPSQKRAESEGETAIEKARGKSQERLLKSVEGVVAASRELQAPLRTNLIGKMGENDVIELPESPKPMSKAEASNKLSKSTRSKPTSHYVDHVYLIQSVNMKKSPYEVALEYGDVAFTAKLILSDEDSQKLWEEFKAAHAKGSVAALPLQVTARINLKKEVVDGEVVGIGGVREGSKKLSQLLKSEEDE